MQNTKGKPRVFVTDASYPNGLAAIRALGRSGFQVTAAERATLSLPATIGFWSRYSSKRLRFPDPRKHPEEAAAALADHFRHNRYAAAIPVGLDMVDLFIKHQQEFAVPVMLPSKKSFEIASDKRLTFEHARGLGIPIPRTVRATDWQSMEPPCVFKSPRTGATIAASRQAASEEAARLGPALTEFLVQEYVPGENGFGYFGFFQNGHETAYFMHERLMQFPKAGGPSVTARAIRNPRLRELGRTLLESLSWHGAAMVEFKRSDRDGEFYLMEINPKLWGSLDLAIQSGCNFPAWIAGTLSGRAVTFNNDYREGLIYQWVIPNGLKCFLKYPEFRSTFLSNLMRTGVRTDLSWMDPVPTLAGLIAMAGKLGRRL